MLPWKKIVLFLLSSWFAIEVFISPLLPFLLVGMCHLVYASYDSVFRISKVLLLGQFDGSLEFGFWNGV